MGEKQPYQQAEIHGGDRVEGLSLNRHVQGDHAQVQQEHAAEHGPSHPLGIGGHSPRLDEVDPYSSRHHDKRHSKDQQGHGPTMRLRGPDRQMGFSTKSIDDSVHCTSPRAC